MTKYQVHRCQPLNVVVVEGIWMEGMTSIQRRYNTFHKQKANHCPHLLLSADRQRSCHVERSSTLQLLRRKAMRISKAKRRKRVTRDMSTLKNSMLELAAKFDDNYNTGLIKSFMFGLNKTEIKTMTDILSRYKFRDSHDDIMIFGKNSEYKLNITFYPDYLKLLKTNFNSNRVEFLDLDLHLINNNVVSNIFDKEIRLSSI
ncbi:hypothetical protein TNCV_1022571 [Trichonephila clavipes]|nr:hypothetical protein TNCV_1022571 [Trichonephila clavipes]